VSEADLPGLSRGCGWGSGESECGEQIAPGREDQEIGDGPQVFEEAAARSHLFHGPAPEIFGQIADGMESEGQEVERYEHGRKIVLPVAEIVFEVVSVGF
jgi:hypothetical protein